MKDFFKIIGVVAVCLIMAYCMRGGCGSPTHNTEVTQTEVKRDTTYIRDTIFITTPAVSDTKPLGVVSTTLPIYRPQLPSDESKEQLQPDQEVELQRSEPPDSATVEIPIEQKHYAGDNYEAWVSGYMAKMDSLRVFPETKLITTSTEVTRWKTKRWGLSIGAGIVATPTRIEPGIFIGASYTFFAF